MKPLARICLLLLILGGLVFPPASPAGEEISEYGNPFTWVSLGQVKVKAEVVSSPEKLYLGLGQRQGLPEGRGLLFIMPAKAMQIFCMRDMHFPIDIIWIVDGRVAGMAKNVSPLDQQALCRSPEPVNYVLEVPGGFCDRHGVKAGDPAAW